MNRTQALHYNTPTGRAVEQYIRQAPPGIGISVSSNQAVLRAAAVHFLESGQTDARETVFAMALRAERERANGRAIGAQDVAAVIYGGALEIHTAISGAVEVHPIVSDPEWLAEHLLLAFEPSGRRHDVPTLLDDLFGHPYAGRYVDAISALGRGMAAAVRGSDLAQLSRHMRRYVDLFDDWSGGRYLNADIRRIAEDLEAAISPGLLAYKAPGAGASSSIVAAVAQGARLAAEAFFHGLGWSVAPIRLAGGLEGQNFGSAGAVFRAGHRVDLIGAADLGQDQAVGRAGVCVALAIEPLSELWVRRAPVAESGYTTDPTLDPLVMTGGLGI